MTFKLEYLGEIEFVFKNNLGAWSGAQELAFDEKKPTSKISCKCTFKVVIRQASIPPNAFYRLDKVSLKNQQLWARKRKCWVTVLENSGLVHFLVSTLRWSLYLFSQLLPITPLHYQVENTSSLVHMSEQSFNYLSPNYSPLVLLYLGTYCMIFLYVFSLWSRTTVVVALQPYIL